MKCVSVIVLMCGFAVVELVRANNVAKYTSVCKTPNNDPGQCIPLRKCQTLNAIIQNKTIAPQAVQFLRQSECGFAGRFRIFCCADEYNSATPWLDTPVDSSTPEASAGSEEVTQSMFEVDAFKPKDKPTTLSPFLHPNRVFLPMETCGRQDVSDPSALAKLGEQPWSVLLKYQNGDGDTGFSCGGVLISKRYVLTAAHCTSAGNTRGRTLISVRIGEHDLATDPDCEESEDGAEYCGEPVVDVEHEVIHPGYNRDDASRRHDIALVRLVPHLLTNLEEVTPICLPINEDVQSGHLNDDIHDLSLTGWGITDNSPTSSSKTTSPAELLNRNACASFYESRDLSTSQLCTVTAEPCAVDNGGALISHDKDGRYHVAGIAAHGAETCGPKNMPIVWTRVASYSSWILDHILP